MFEVGDYIMYGLTGVCKVEDITDESFRNCNKRKYYVLNPVYSKGTVIKTPVDNEKVTMRKIITKEQVNDLINNMKSIDNMWINDDRVRSEEFKAMLKSGDCEELIKVIRSIYFNKESKKTLGKKSHKVDEDIMKEAERLINEEFSISLNIPIEDVLTYIEGRV